MKSPLIVDTCIFSYDFNNHTLAMDYAKDFENISGLEVITEYVAKDKS